MELKWSWKFGQRVEVYPDPLEGYEIAKRGKFSDQFKAQIALEALRGDRTIHAIAAKHQVHPNPVSTWKRQAVEGMADVFARGGKAEGPTGAEVKERHAKIGRPAVENDILSQGLKR